MTGRPPVPGSLEWMRLVVERADQIFVRIQRDERWVSVALSECTQEEQARVLLRLIVEQRGAPL